MSDNLSIAATEEAFWFSSNKIAKCYGVARETVLKRLTNVTPVGHKNGGAVYHLRDVSELVDTRQKESYADKNPEEMAPKDRRDWYAGESERLKLQAQRSELIPADEFRDELSSTIKQLIQFIDTLPDVLDQSLNLDPQVIERIQQLCDDQRETLYQSLSDE